MLQHAFYNGICAFAVVVYFLFILFDIISYCFYFLDIAFINFLFISSINSVFTSEKLFTKFKGFCISWAMPAVSSPREAIFSD